jgi:hypothetical protein
LFLVPKTTNDPPKTFQDILPPQLITTSTLSEAGYIGYRKSKLKLKSARASTFPPLPPPKSHTPRPSIKLPTLVIDQSITTTTTTKTATTVTTATQRNFPSTSRRSTLKKMKGVMHTIKRSISSLHESKKKTSRLPIPFPNAFDTSNPRSRFGTGPGRQTFGRQDGGYLNLSGGEDRI